MSIEEFVAIVHAKLYLRWYLVEFYGYPETIELTYLETHIKHNEPRYIFELKDGRRAVVLEWAEKGKKCYRAFWHEE